MNIPFYYKPTAAQKQEVKDRLNQLKLAAKLAKLRHRLGVKLAPIATEAPAMQVPL